MIRKLTKTAVIALLFLANATHAQSEQETLTWLAQKLTAYVKPHERVYGGVGFTDLKVTKIEPCAITITFQQKQLIRNKLLCTMTLVLPTDGISITDRGMVQYRDAVIEYTTTSASPNVPAKTKYLNTTPDIFIEEAEDNLLVKVQEKMHQAATFCPGKQ